MFHLEAANSNISRLRRTPEILYFSGVLGMMDDALYDRALMTVRKQHPFAAIISGRDVWANAEAWRLTFESVLAPATHAVFLPYPDFAIGLGVFQEIAYFERRASPLRKLALIDSKLRIDGIVDVRELDNPTPTRFAMLVGNADLDRQEDRKPAKGAQRIKGTKLKVH